MKIIETSFKEYLENTNNFDLHPELEIDKFSKKLEEINNIIIYGPPGIGKYSQALKIINNYSSSNLKYDKKIQLQGNKDDTIMIHISDIHYEIDMDLLGCNSKTLFHGLYVQICDSIRSSYSSLFVKNKKQKAEGIILCKNFKNIQTELLDTFYAYLTSTNDIILRFIIITDSIGFIPKSITESCNIISLSRPKKNSYVKLLSLSGNKNENIKFNVDNIKNIKNLLLKNDEIDVNTIFLDRIKNLFNETKGNNIDIDVVRNIIYDAMTYNISMDEFIFEIINFLYTNKYINRNNNKLIEIVINFHQQYKNNYRPIFHLEKCLLDLIKLSYENK